MKSTNYKKSKEKCQKSENIVKDLENLYEEEYLDLIEDVVSEGKYCHKRDDHLEKCKYFMKWKEKHRAIYMQFQTLLTDQVIDDYNIANENGYCYLSLINYVINYLKIHKKKERNEQKLSDEKRIEEKRSFQKKTEEGGVKEQKTEKNKLNNQKTTESQSKEQKTAKVILKEQKTEQKTLEEREKLEKIKKDEENHPSPWLIMWIKSSDFYKLKYIDWDSFEVEECLIFCDSTFSNSLKFSDISLIAHRLLNINFILGPLLTSEKNDENVYLDLYYMSFLESVKYFWKLLSSDEKERVFGFNENIDTFYLKEINKDSILDSSLFQDNINVLCNNIKYKFCSNFINEIKCIHDILLLNFNK